MGKKAPNSSLPFVRKISSPRARPILYVTRKHTNTSPHFAACAHSHSSTYYSTHNRPLLSYIHGDGKAESETKKPRASSSCVWKWSWINNGALWKRKKKKKPWERAQGTQRWEMGWDGGNWVEGGGRPDEKCYAKIIQLNHICAALKHQSIITDKSDSNNGRST